MMYLKLFENFNSEDIDSICKKYGIVDYTINNDGSIDVIRTTSPTYYIWLDKRGFTELPLKFRNVNCSFVCSNNYLTTLNGCPENIDGGFHASYNKLTSLEGGPKSVNGDYYCNDNELRTLEWFPFNVKSFVCGGNPVCVLWKLFHDKEKVELFNDFGITDGEVVILERLNEFLEMIGKPKVNSYVIESIKDVYKII